MRGQLWAHAPAMMDFKFCKVAPRDGCAKVPVGVGAEFVEALTHEAGVLGDGVVVSEANDALDVGSDGGGDAGDGVAGGGAADSEAHALLKALQRAAVGGLELALEEQVPVVAHRWMPVCVCDLSRAARPAAPSAWA